MNELLPLIESSESSHTRALLQAGRNDPAPHDFSQRLLVGLGLGAAISGASAVATASAAGAAAHGAAGSGAAGLGVLTAKWVAVGVLGGGILAGGADLAFSPPRAAPVSVVASSPAPTPPAKAAPIKVDAPQLADREPEPEGSPSAEPTSKAARAPSNAAFAEAPPAAGGSLGREVAAIDRARRALSAGDLKRALAELDGFDRIALSGVLDREAKVLRIETLLKAGQVERARLLFEQYQRAFPNDPHAARLRALMGAEQH